MDSWLSEIIILFWSVSKKGGELFFLAAKAVVLQPWFMSPNTEILQRIFKTDGHIGNVLSNLGWGIKTLYAIVFLVAVVALIISITKLAGSGDAPVRRRSAMHDILISGICVACLGSIGLIFIALVGFM